MKNHRLLTLLCSLLFARKESSANVGSIVRNSVSLLVLLCLSVGNVWGDDKSGTVTFYKSGSKLTTTTIPNDNAEVAFTFSDLAVNSSSTKICNTSSLYGLKGKNTTLVTITCPTGYYFKSAVFKLASFGASETPTAAIYSGTTELYECGAHTYTKLDNSICGDEFSCEDSITTFVSSKYSTLSVKETGNSKNLTVLSLSYTISNDGGCSAKAPGDISKGSWDGAKLTLTAAGSAVSGDTWYWQTAAEGTEKDTYGSGATKDVTAAATWYLRSYNTAGDCWSTAKSVTVEASDLLNAPTVTFTNGAYEVGSSALNLSSLFSSNSDGAVTYSVKTDGGTSASITGTSFSATQAGTCVVTATQAATASYSSKSVDANIIVTYPMTGTAIVTYNLDVTSGGSTLQTTSVDATASTLTVATSTSLLAGGLEKSSSKGTHNGTRTLGINTLSAEDADKYFYVTFNIAAGYQFTPSAISLKVLTIGGNATSYKAVLTDGVNSITGTASATNDSEVTLGSWDNLGTTVLTGNVTLKLYAWYTTSGSYNAYRLSTPITITGTVAAAIPCTDPAAPTAFATTAVAGSTATFSITDDADAASYDLYYSMSSSAPTAGTAATETVTTKTPTITGLTASTTYYAWVRAVCDADHKSEWVALTGSSFTTTKLTPNSYNVGAVAEGECVGSMTAKITLSGSQVGVDYQLKNNGVNDGSALPGTGSALEWTGKGSGVYTVWAVENATYTGLQMNKTATIAVYPTTAITTQPALAVAAEINVSFTVGTGMVAAGNELAYRWYTCGSTGTDTVFIAGATSATYSDSKAALGTYYYRVRVEGTCGEPVLSNIITVTVTSEVPPSEIPTISVQPAGAAYCAGDGMSALSVTASGSGTLTYQWRKDGVDISGATSATYLPSEAGTYACKVTNTEDGKIAMSLVSNDAVVTINPAVAAPVITQTDNTVNLATATAGATIYYTTDGSDPTTGSASGTSVSIVADCTVKAYAVKDGCESAIESFAATFDSSVKECAVLITYTLPGSGTATTAIPADENNLVGGTADYNVGSNSISGGYKLESNQYFGLTLATGQFKAGDKVTVTITKASDQDDKGLYLNSSKTGAAVASIAAGDVVVGENVFTLTSDCDAIYVARSSSCNQNPYVKSISVCRTLTKYTVTFDKNNVLATGTMSDQSFYDGFAAKLTANSFSLTDYEFAGWATDPIGSKVYDDQESVTMTGNSTLYAIWEPAKYTLTNTVNPAGYGTVDVASVDDITPGTITTSSANTYTVNGTTVTATPAATTAEYTYAFDSWSGLPATVTADATVTANFTRTPRSYTVTLNTNGGTINAGNVTSYTYGTGAMLPTDVTKAGADFGGWYDNSSLSGSAVTEVSGTDTGDKAYWAKWIVCPADESGETVYRFVTKSDGLGTDNVCAVEDTDYPMSTSNALSELIGGTLTARSNGSVNRLKYKTNAFTFANGEGGVLRVDLDCPIRTGDVIRFINSATNTGYNAYVRHTSSSTTTNQINLAGKNPTIATIQMPDGFTGKKTLYIVRGENNNALISYFEIVRPLVVTLDAQTNGGKVGGEDRQRLYSVSGETLVLPHATKDGFRFKGWYDAPSGGNAAANPYNVTVAATLYAQFEDCPTDGLLYKFEVGTGLTNGSVTENNVTFEFTEANYLTTLIGGTLTTGGSAASNVKIANNNAISIESSSSAYIRVDMDCPLEEGDIFKSTVSNNASWVTSTPSSGSTAILPKGTLTQTPVPAALAGAKTLYIWRGGGNTRIQYFEITRPKLTQITLSATEAFNKYTTSVVATYGEAMPEIATLPVRTGYIFGGYYTGTGGTGTQYYDGMGYSVRNWDIDAQETTLYAYWITPCEAAPTLEKVVPVVTIWDGKETDLSLVKLSCNYDTTDIHYSLQSASEDIPGCTYFYVDERIYIKGVPALSNTSTEIKTITFTMTNDCSPASTYTVDATIRIYPASQKARIAYIITGTMGGDFDDYSTDNESASNALLTYLRGFYTVDCVNGYATKDSTAIANFYKDYDLLIVTDYLETPEGYTNAIGTLIDKKPILSFEAYVAGENGTNWHIGSNPKDPSPKVKTMKILCAGHAIFGDAEGVDVINDADTTVQVLSSTSGKGLQGFVINEAPDFIFLATARDADNNRDLIVCCERQVVFPARLLLYGINYNEMGNLSDAGRVVMHQMIDYLLMTDESKAADCSLVFDNKDGNKRWDNPKNWAPGYNIVPTPYHPTRIIAECHVYTEDAHAGSVKVNTGRDDLGHPVDGKLIIEPTGGLTVAGLVMKVNDTRYASPITIKAEDLLIKADANHSGAFVYGNKESDVRATVEYYSRGSASNTANPVWQYMGVPFQAGQTAIRMYYEAWMCRWVEGSSDGLGGLWQWVDINDVLVPFEGYCITQEAAKTYTNAGKLNPPVTQTIALDNRDGDGFAFAANSWTAPIKIQEMQDADFTNAEKAIYIYHSGTYDSWETNKETIINTKDDGATPVPGQYAVIPIHSSPYIGADSVIPAMQGFFVKTTAADATLDLVYNRVVYDAKYFKTSTQPMRAPRREADDRPDVMVLRVAGDTYSDRVHILSQAGFTDEYEDGWDGRKIAGDDAAPMLAVVKGEDIMAVAAVATADEHYLSFRAGEDSVYTFAFDYQGETIYLYDLLTAEATEIKTGNTYTFEATNRTPEQRFLITKNPPRMPTGTENTEVSGETDGSVRKILLNDRIYIIRGNEIHDVTGKKVSQPQRKEGRQ